MVNLSPETSAHTQTLPMPQYLYGVDTQIMNSIPSKSTTQLIGSSEGKVCAYTVEPLSFTWSHWACVVDIGVTILLILSYFHLIHNPLPMQEEKRHHIILWILAFGITASLKLIAFIKRHGPLASVGRMAALMVWTFYSFCVFLGPIVVISFVFGPAMALANYSLYIRHTR